MWGEVTQRFTAIVVIPQRLKEEEENTGAREGAGQS